MAGIRNEFRFNELQNARYSFTVVNNGIRYEYIHTSSGPKWELELNINYMQLQETLRNQLCHDNTDSGEQQYRNHKSTLQQFMIYVGKTDTDRIGLELKSRFDEQMADYLDSLNIKDRTKSDRRSHMNRWKSIFESLEASANGQSPKPLKDFNQALKQALLNSGLTLTELCEKSNTSKSVVSKWLRGAHPNVRSRPSINRVEKVLGLERDALANLVRNDLGAQHAHAQDIDYRRRLSHLVKQIYKLPEENISPELRNEWQLLFRHKTSELTQLKRIDLWRLRPLAALKKLPPEACIGNLGCPTAETVWNNVLNFLGFLRLPKTEGGYGLDVGEVQSLAILAVPELIQAFMEFKRQRSDGIKHGWHRRFAGIVSSLVKTNTGYLRQLPDYISRVPSSLLLGRNWDELCDKTFELAGIWKSTSTGKSRHPDEPIRALLALPQPMAPILRAIQDIDALAAQAPSGGITQARHKRDALLLAFLLSVPLRALNFRIMKWNAFGTGHLHRTPNGQFRLRFSADEMKNHKPFDVPISGWLVSRIEEYIEEYRDVVNDGQRSELVFKYSNGDSDKYCTLNKRVLKLTRRHLPETPGFGIHAFRHLVATDWLMKNQNDFMTAADLLGDNLQTVIDNYAHLKKDVAFERYEKYLMAFRTAM